MVLDTAYSVFKQHCKNCFINTPVQWEASVVKQAFKSDVSNLTVLNHDDIIDFKSVAYFPEYAKLLSDKCYKDTNNNVPSSSKSNKVKWSNVVQLKFIEEKSKAMLYKYEILLAIHCWMLILTHPFLTQPSSLLSIKRSEEPFF